MALRLASPFFRRAVVTLGVASVALVGASAPSSAAEVDELLPPLIDTYTGWDGTSYVYPFGHENTATYGQTITVPDGKRRVKYFTFYMASDTGTGTMIMRGAIYGWDGTKATKAKWESEPTSVDFTAGDPEFRPVRFTVTGTKLRPGKQYVFFASISKDYEETAPFVLSRWAANTTDVLPGGDVVYQNNGTDESQWTTTEWSSIPGYDFALKAQIK